MARPPQQQPSSGVDQAIDKQITAIDGEAAPTEQPPREEIYKLDPLTAVPVSKYEGPVWKGRRDASNKLSESLFRKWDEAEYYYNNTQDAHRKETAGNQQGNRNYGKDRRDSFSMTENIVYSTVNAVIPNTYAKNPSIEVTMADESEEEFGTMLEHLGNRLASMHYAPGIYLKPKVKKSIVRCEITNEAWVLIGWTKKDDSADGAREDIARIGQELAQAKDQETIVRLEGELMALEESIDLLDPAGPWVKTVRGDQIRVDTASVEDDIFSDSNWIMVEMMLSTAYLNARYRRKNEDGTYANIYNPSHVVDAQSTQSQDAVQKDIDTFKIFENGRDNPKDYGYGDVRTYERAKRTKVWYCFDKVKRRFYLFADNDWTWPIWVFDDPYAFPDFYPLARLTYHSDPKVNRTAGEVSHYLDQQDAVNVIEDEKNRARISLRDNTIFNSNVLTQKDVEDIILNGNKKLKGVKVPDGQKLSDLIMGPPMPNLQYEHLWDSSGPKSAVNVISGVGEAMRGEQFKTNTTNEAIAQYSSISGVRLDEKRDAIEDFVGMIMSKVLFLWLRFGDAETTIELVGPKYADAVQMINQLRDPKEIRKRLICSIEGGSTQKPTSPAKKAEALQVGQILGQFASTTPVILLVLLKVFQRAFDGMAMTDADWDAVTQGIQQQMAIQQMKAQGGPQQEANEGENPDDEKMIQDMMKEGMPRQEAEKRVREAKSNKQ